MAEAQDAGIAALAFLAAEPELLQRFLGMSGLEVADLRQAAAGPGFFPALLDFILADETTLLRFAEHAALQPERVVGARRALGGSSGIESA